jgi:hypothetical protein
VALRRVTHGEHKQRTLTACADADWYRAELWTAPIKGVYARRGIVSQHDGAKMDH